MNKWKILKQSHQKNSEAGLYIKSNKKRNSSKLIFLNIYPSMNLNKMQKEDTDAKLLECNLTPFYIVEGNFKLLIKTLFN